MSSRRKRQEKVEEQERAGSSLRKEDLEVQVSRALLLDDHQIQTTGRGAFPFLFSISKYSNANVSALTFITHSLAQAQSKGLGHFDLARCARP